MADWEAHHVNDAGKVVGQPFSGGHRSTVVRRAFDALPVSDPSVCGIDVFRRREDGVWQLETQINVGTAIDG